MNQMTRRAMLLINLVIFAPSIVKGSQDVRHVSYSIEIRNRSAQCIDIAKLFVWLPQKSNTWQQCADLAISQPFKVNIDEVGNRHAVVTLENIRPFQVINVKIHVQIDMQNSVLPSKGWIHLGKKEQPYIEFHDALIKDKSRALVGSSNMETAKNFFQWISQNISKDSFSSRDRGALFALNNKRGDCSEMAYLFVAFCRAVGIPAHFHSGYKIEQSGKLNPREFHNWASFFNGENWVTVDPFFESFQPVPNHYLVFTTQVAQMESIGKRFMCEHPDLHAVMK